jgi:hypothetical protein
MVLYGGRKSRSNEASPAEGGTPWSNCKGQIDIECSNLPVAVKAHREAQPPPGPCDVAEKVEILIIALGDIELRSQTP